MDEIDLVTVMHAATRILAARVLVMVCLLMVFGLFCWAMWMATPIALGTAAGFGIMVFLPCLAADRKKETNNGKEN